MSVSAPGRAPAHGRHGPAPHRPRRLALASVWMLGVFALWTVAFVAVSGWVSDSADGRTVNYIVAWLPWIGATALWVLPLAAGVVLGILALRSGAGRLARIGIALNAIALALMVTLPLADRLIPG